MKVIIFAASLMATPAFALDWTQPILDEQGATIPDWQNCPGKDPKTDKCDKVITLGLLTARALLQGPPQIRDAPPQPPEQKALEGRLGLEIIEHPDLVPTPDQLKIARDAIGRLPSPLAVARAWDLLDKAVK